MTSAEPSATLINELRALAATVPGFGRGMWAEAQAESIAAALIAAADALAGRAPADAATAAAFGRLAEAYDTPPVETPQLSVTLARTDWRLILKSATPAGSDD